MGRSRKICVVNINDSILRKVFPRNNAHCYSADSVIMCLFMASKPLAARV